MKKIILTSLAISVLSGCVSIDTRAIDRLFGNETLTNQQFCEMKKANLKGTKAQYQGKLMIPTGKITVIQKQGSDSVIGIKAGNDTVYAKVKNLKGNKIGDVVTVKGKISDANFRSATECAYFLLDDAVIQ